MQISQLLRFAFLYTSLAAAAALKPKFVKFDVQSTTAKQLYKRDSEETSLEDVYTYYLTQITVGSDSQTMDVLVDTGSNALFVIDSGSCSSCSDGTFDSSSSSSYSKIDDSFSITYGSGTASGEWGTDTVAIGGASISDLRLGVATTYPAEFGVLGLTVSPDDSGSSPSYENLPKRLKSDGIIDKIAYSFYAGEHGDGLGSLLFGAIDNSKYTGSLYTVPMTSNDTTVTVDGVNIDSSDSAVTAQTLFDSSVTVLIDTGTSVTTLPTDAFNALISALDATLDGSTYYVDCGLVDAEVYLNYNFSGIRIKVSIKDLIYQSSSTSCMLGVSSTDSSLIIGANALRSIYTVFDLEGYEIGLAQANKDPGSEDIEVISSSIPTK